MNTSPKKKPLSGSSTGGPVAMCAARNKHTDICMALDVDREIGECAWSIFSSLNDTYTLAGLPVHWIGLAIYAECMQSKHKFKHKKVEYTLEGNQISFTKMLKLCDLNASEFFAKMKNWTEMTSVPDHFKRNMEKLERNFQVTVVLFKKLRKIFYNIFVSFDPVKAAKTKIKPNLCSTSLLFEFCWYLFICCKGEFKDQSDDLVNMYHVLLGCIDLVFSNAYSSQRKDLVDPKLSVLPPNWATPKGKISDPPCLISYLCEKYGASTVDAKKMKQYDLKNKLENFFHKEFLKGNKDKFSNLIDPVNFSFNLTSLSKIYGTYMLNTGEFDERVLLVERGTGSKLSENEISKTISLYEIVAPVPSTPLTGRQYLINKNDNMTPVTMAIQPSMKLQEYLLGHSNSPSAVLTELLEKCKDNPIDIIMNRQKEMAILFLTSYSKLFSEDLTGHRLNLIEVLYYKLLEQILIEEQLKHPNIDPQVFFHEMFHKTLFACCTEIVIFASQPFNPRFPWVLDCYELDAFYLYKIIELVVSTIRERLGRDVIKHLSTIEENILDSLSWKSDSPLWVKIKELNEPIPQYCDVKIGDVNPTNNQNVDLKPDITQSSSGSNANSNDAIIRPGQSLLSQNLNNSAGEISDNALPRKKPVRGGSLGLFFRKFFNLAYTRLQNLCDNLRLRDEMLIKKIWTCLEHGVIQQTHLMKDRHLDQILMCTVYAMCKISNNQINVVERSFTEIMRCYRFQPQAKNHIYRDVLLSANSTESDNENISPASLNRTNAPVRGDLIKFYNTIFVQSMEKLITTFGRERNEHSEGSEMPERLEVIAIQLSPLPDIRRNHRMSPGAHRVSDKHRLFVSPLTSSSIHEGVCGPHTTRFSCTSNSSRDLQHINTLMCSESQMTIKRPFLLEESDPVEKKIASDILSLTKRKS